MMPRVTERDRGERDDLHKRIPVAAGTRPKEEQVVQLEEVKRETNDIVDRYIMYCFFFKCSEYARDSQSEKTLLIETL